MKMKTIIEIKKEIEKHELFKKMMEDSHGGLVYDIDDLRGYDKGQARNMLAIWESLDAIEKEGCEGIVNGAMEMLREYI